MKINLNDTVSVVLTEKGAKTLNAYNAPFSKLDGAEQHVYLANEKYEAQLWEMFEIFGATLRVGASAPFYKNIINFADNKASKIYADAEIL